jgi:light-regulated signal transduction histidine kinase (bacteriophytochrome)
MHPEAAGGARVNAILLLLDQAENRRLLTNLLEESYQVLVPDSEGVPPGDFDLCVADGPAARRMNAWLKERREAALPVFLPVLILTSRPELDIADEGLRECVDDLIVTPVHKAELRAQVGILLRTRRLTRELSAANKDLQQFAYVASHDLQEPLRMVTSFVQLLADRYRGKLDKDADEFIGFAVDGATRMQALIEGLLDYSRVGTRGKELERTDSETVLQQAEQNLKVAVEESGAEITHDPLPTVTGDDMQLTELLQNLIANAIKFRGADEPPRIHVSAELKEGEWVFSVRDNGIGIAQADMGRLFQIFTRLHARDEYPGTGIGLAVCKRIVERHGGRIWVESEPGKGSTFYFTIPDRPAA